jgi:hypothetical protein
MTVELSMVRQMWQLLEPVHAILYYAPEVFERAEKLGYAIDTRWPSYFAWRAAPLGPAGPELVAATFYSINPAMVRAHVPAAWDVANPDEVLAARGESVDAALRAVLPDQVPEEAADLAKRLVEAASTAARPLGAANAELPWPAEPHLVLWQAATIMRELRGDGHVAALLTAGLDPVESLVSFAAVGAAPVEVFASRGWSPEEWAAATNRLVERGWLTEDGTATDAGRAGRAELERMTDELAAPAYRALGAERVGRLAGLVVPVTMAVVASGMLPRRSTLGMGR